MTVIIDVAIVMTVSSSSAIRTKSYCNPGISVKFSIFETQNPSMLKILKIWRYGLAGQGYQRAEKYLRILADFNMPILCPIKVENFKENPTPKLVSLKVAEDGDTG